MKTLFRPLLDHHDRGISLEKFGPQPTHWLEEEEALKEHPLPETQDLSSPS